MQVEIGHTKLNVLLDTAKGKVTSLCSSSIARELHRCNSGAVLRHCVLQFAVIDNEQCDMLFHSHPPPCCDV